MKYIIYPIFMLLSYGLMGQTVTKIPIKNLQGKPILQARINGKKASFLIDTGSDISVINSTQLRRFDLKDRKVYNVTGGAMGFNGTTTELRKVYGVQVHFTRDLSYGEFYSLNLDRISNQIEAKTHVRIDGIIGADVLSEYDCTIDYGTGHLTMRSKAKKGRSKDLDIVCGYPEAL